VAKGSAAGASTLYRPENRLDSRASDAREKGFAESSGACHHSNGRTENSSTVGVCTCWSRMAQWQSARLLIAGLKVRVLLRERFIGRTSGRWGLAHVAQRTERLKDSNLAASKAGLRRHRDRASGVEDHRLGNLIPRQGSASSSLGNPGSDVREGGFDSRRGHVVGAVAELLGGGAGHPAEGGAEHADRLMNQADGHLASADPLTRTDPSSAFALLYDGARKAMAAVLAQQVYGQLGPVATSPSRRRSKPSSGRTRRWSFAPSGPCAVAVMNRNTRILVIRRSRSLKQSKVSRMHWLSPRQ
jgi:hypothetical protein